ncbi:MAG: hypothetical protein GX552_13295, partial [Chloroflexi bacterium]|nr:hypothetical protein [Chloroflexota bacterium]
YFADSFFCDPGRGHLIDYADKHWYANTNSNNPEVISLTWQDSAAYVREAWVRFNEYRVGFNYNKPIVRGEGGVAQYNTEPQHPDIARDPTGTYYHKKLWAHVGSLGYLCDGEWYPRLFVMKIIGQFPSPEHNLEGMFAAYERFMQGEPLANGNYACIGTDLRGADQVLMANVGGNLRAWGVRDALAGRALLWIDNASHTWKSVVDGAQITPASGDLTVQGLPPGTYTVEWWDTTQGAVTRTDTREVGSNGRLGLRVDGLTTDVAVKIAPLLPTSKEYTLSLHKGWNLISSPLLPENANITDILAPVAGVYDSVYTYDASNGANPWRRYNPMAAPALQTLNAIDEKMGLWIHVEKDTTLPIEGAAPSAVSIPLYKGWNLVGYPSLTPRSVQDAFSSIAGAYDLVYTLDSTDPWQSYDAALAAATGAAATGAAATADAATSGAVAANSALNGLAQMEPGKGYWVRVKQDCVWTVAP